MSSTYAVGLEGATMEIRKSKSDPVEAVSRFCEVGDYMDSLMGLRSAQGQLSELISSSADKSGIHYQDMYSRQSATDRTPLDNEIERLRIQMSEPLRQVLTYTLGALRKIEFSDGPMQIVESVMLKADNSIPLIPYYEKPDSGGDLGTTVKVIFNDPTEIWFGMYPEAFTNIQSRPWLLLLDAFIGCIDVKKILGENVNTEDVKSGIKTILQQARTEGFEVDHGVKMQLAMYLQ